MIVKATPNSLNSIQWTLVVKAEFCSYNKLRVISVIIEKGGLGLCSALAKPKLNQGYLETQVIIKSWKTVKSIKMLSAHKYDYYISPQ